MINPFDIMDTRLSNIENLLLELHLPSLQAPPKDEIIDREELCKRLDITETTAITWQNKGKIPALKIGAQYRYNWPAVIKALEIKRR